MADLEDILENESTSEVFQKTYKRIIALRCGSGEMYESYSKKMSDEERVIVLAYFFVLEVANGGLSQFLSNSSGDLAEETCAAMHVIGASIAAAALDDARTVIFDASLIPADRSLRCDVLFAWEEEDESRSETFYRKHKLGWCEPVEQAAAQYIRAHRASFP